MEHRRYGQQNHRPWQEETFQEETSYQMDPVEMEPFRDRAEEIVATNRMVLLTCTLASMMPPFALFLLFAERKSRAIRHFALQSLALTICHLILGGMLVLLNAMLGGIPFLGFLMNLVLWIIYISAVLVMLVLRIRMMFFAWRGAKFLLPWIGRRVERFNR